MAQSVSIYTVTGEDEGPQKHCSVLAGALTTTQEVIQLALQEKQVYEDASFYSLSEWFSTEPSIQGRPLLMDERPVELIEKWESRRWRGELKLVLKKCSLQEMDTIRNIVSRLSPNVEDHLTDDMCNLTELSETTMLDTLHTRFGRNIIYTYVGSILVSINPYFFYPIYNPNFIQKYQSMKLGELEPHIFAIADDSYNSMLSDKADKSVIISGESGAGKTECTKFLLHHLMSLSAKFEDECALELITLGTGPVLEAFGNAMTVSNDNSSRFGKFITVNFRENGAYYSASIQQYLLEKSRIILQAANERNYHVFYYLLGGADVVLKKECRLESDYWTYLTHGRLKIDDVNDADEFHRLKRSLSMLGFSQELQTKMFRVLAAILHLGNIHFVKDENSERCQMKTESEVEIVSSLLKVDPDSLVNTLTTRKTRAGGHVIVVPYKLEEAVATRDSTAKALYEALFNWIVNQVNIALAGARLHHRHRGNSIGVLDIFGFEVYKFNSFEQFCINFANEQLQQYFNKHVFKSEQEEYILEGIVWNAVNYTDNTECLELISKRPTGLLLLLDEECSFPGANDSSLFDKFEKEHKRHSHYKSSPVRQKNPEFTIVHYAGDVFYHIRGFREKNRDLMRQDIIELLKTARSNLIRSLIGLPSLAVAHWEKLKTAIRVTAVFRQAGQSYFKKREGRGNSLRRLESKEGKNSNKGKHKKSENDLWTRFHRNKIKKEVKEKRRSSLFNGKMKCRTSPKHKAHTLATALRKGPAPTVGAQFNTSLSLLMDTLESTKPYFVRCIKSNSDKAPRKFDNEVVLRQLRYTGMLQTIRIRKSGYPVRMAFQDFFEKYHFMMGKKEPDLPNQIARFLTKQGISLENMEAQIGKSKVFMREEQKQLLQQRLHEEVLVRIIVIQRWIRTKLARIHFMTVKRSAITIQSHIRGWLARIQYNETRHQIGATVVIQSWWRCVHQRRCFLNIKSAAIIVQSWYKGYRQRQTYLQDIEVERRRLQLLKEAHEKALQEAAALECKTNKGTTDPTPGDTPEAKLKGVIPQQDDSPLTQSPNKVNDPKPPGPIDTQTKDRIQHGDDLINTSLSSSSITEEFTSDSETKSTSNSSFEGLQQSSSSDHLLHRRAAKKDKDYTQKHGRYHIRSNQPSTDLKDVAKQDSTTSKSVGSLDRHLLSPKGPLGPTPSQSPVSQTFPKVRDLSSVSFQVDENTGSLRGKASLVRTKQKRWRTGGHINCHYFRSHMFRRGEHCSVCTKAFSGFLKQGLKCEVCKTCSHHHCLNRVEVCPSAIQGGNRLTFSKKKIIKSIQDLDEFDQFLIEKIASLHPTDENGVDFASKIALTQFHTAVVTNLSLKLQKSDETHTTSSGGGDTPPSGKEEITATFAQLVVQFTHIVKAVAKSQGLHEGYIQVAILQLKGMLDEFVNSQQVREEKRKKLKLIKPDLANLSSKVQGTKSELRQEARKSKQIFEHKGHYFLVQMFNLLTICEFCSKQIPVLTPGVVCEVCSYTCHEGCYKKVNKKCNVKHQETKASQDEAIKVQTAKLKTQFGVPLKKLVPGKVVRVPMVLERMLQHLEQQALQTQGLYRKTPSPSNKVALKDALDRDPLGVMLEQYQIHSSASLVKLFFQQLPQPLTTFELYREFLLCTELSNPALKLRTIHKLIDKLPELNHITLERLIFHLALVADNESANLMDPHNLAIVFAPGLFRSKKEPRPQEMVKELTKATDILEVIINEQLERLRSDLRSIRSLTNQANSLYTELISDRKSEESSPPSETGQERANPERAISPSPGPLDSLHDLTEELGKVELRRTELHTYLPKLQPFMAAYPSCEDMTMLSDGESRPSSSSSDLSDLSPQRTSAYLPKQRKSASQL